MVNAILRNRRNTDGVGVLLWACLCPRQMTQELKTNYRTFPPNRSDEQRGTARYTFAAVVEAVEIRSGVRLSGRTTDISRGGCYIDVISPFALGTEAAVRITHGNRTFTTKGTVVFSQIGNGMGVQFVAAEPEQQRVLEGWLGELNGEMPLEPQAALGSRQLSASVIPIAGSSAAAASGATAVPVAPVPVETGSSNDEPRWVLNELILTLMRKKLLTDAEGKSLLQKLLA
jgi:hypothetical protein